MKRVPILLMAIFVRLLAVSVLWSYNTGCSNNSGESADVAADSVTVATEDTSTLIAPPPPPVSKRTAVLGYAHPGTIRRNENKNINVFVTVRHPESKVKDTLRQLIQSQEITVRQDDTTHIYTRNIALYSHLKVTLIDPANVFTITRVHNNDRQEIDSLEGNRWRWNIVTSTNRPSAVLILKVVAEKPGIPQEDFGDENIHIRIRVDNSSLLRGAWLYLVDHPGTFVTAILIPLVGFLGKWYIEKRKKGEEEKT